MTYFDAKIQNYNNSILYNKNSNPFLTPYNPTDIYLQKGQYRNSSTSTSIQQPQFKKWYGNYQNLSASQRLQEKKYMTIGNSSFNQQNQPISFVSIDSVNLKDEKNARQRVRNRGIIRPKKYNMRFLNAQLQNQSQPIDNSDYLPDPEPSTMPSAYAP